MLYNLILVRSFLIAGNRIYVSLSREAFIKRYKVVYRISGKVRELGLLVAQPVSKQPGEMANRSTGSF